MFILYFLYPRHPFPVVLGILCSSLEVHVFPVLGRGLILACSVFMTADSQISAIDQYRRMLSQIQYTIYLEY